MRKNLLDALILMLCFIILSLLIMFAVDKLDEIIADECRECNAEFSWCQDYWKDKGLCSFTTEKKSLKKKFRD